MRALRRQRSDAVSPWSVRSAFQDLLRVTHSSPLPSPLGQVLGVADEDLELYRLILGRTPLSLAQLAGMTSLSGGEAAAPLQRLIAAGAVARVGMEHERYHARHPQIAFGDRLGMLRRLLTEAGNEVAHLADLAADRAGDHVEERLIGLELVREGLVELLDSARSTIAVVARPEVALPWAGMTGRGLGTRTVWPDHPEVVEGLVPPQPAATATSARAAAVLPSCGLVIVDDQAALVVSLPNGSPVDAVLHRHPGTVAACTALFESIWRSARPVWPLPTTAGDLTEADRVLLGMLHLGLTDATVANRLSISVRTVGRRLEELMRRLDSRTRFQAGVEAARRGWL